MRKMEKERKRKRENDLFFLGDSAEFRERCSS